MGQIGKNQPQLSEELAAAYTADGQQTDADVSNGTVNRDLLDVAASRIAEAYSEMEVARQTASLKNAPSADPDALSQFALNYDVLRAAATRATGTATFQASVRPSATISIPVGTLVWTQPLLDGTVVKYRTTAAASLSASATANPLNGLFEVDVAVQADDAGTAGHVGVNALTVLPNRVAGITSLTNKRAINNAADADSNAALAASVLTKTAGSQLGTPSGYAALILAQFPDDVTGVAVVGPLDADNLRVQFGNEVDVPIVSTNAASFTAILTTSGAPTTKFSSVRPVISVTSVVGTTNGVNYTASVDYGFQRDTAAVYGYSTQSFDALCWFPGRQPGPGLSLSIQGTRDSVVRDVQDFLDDPTRRYITGGLLVKTAQSILVDVSVSVAASSGMDRTQLASDVSAAITDALAALELGTDVLEDDLVEAINAVPGVFSVGIPFAKLRRAADSQDSNASVSIRKQEYARAGTITVTIS